MKQNSNKDMTDKTPTMTASPTNTVAALKIMNYILINSQFVNFKQKMYHQSKHWI